MAACAFLYMDGVENLEIAEKFCNGYCYRRILDHGKFIAQLEPVLSVDDTEDGKGLISIGFVKFKDIEKTLRQLERLGFRGLVEVCGYRDEYDDGMNPIFEYGTEI